ncbi:MAG: hypothetical protein WCU90_15040 [Kiritimatiellia bacterium]|jgi:hypothetical protein|nr:hypothetical protein [Kiritimatiellia bacterium]
MIKLSTAFMKKVPVQGQEFSSQSFHASIELELSDALTPEQIGEKIHRTGEFLRNAVDKELEGAAPADSGKGATAFAGSGQQPQGERKASNKQIKYLTDLAAERKLTLQDLNTDIHRRFGVESVYDLSAKQASALLDEMNGAQRRRAA